jgi:hypothetical protein
MLLRLLGLLRLVLVLSDYVNVLKVVRKVASDRLWFNRWLEVNGVPDWRTEECIFQDLI